MQTSSQEDIGVVVRRKRSLCLKRDYCHVSPAPSGKRSKAFPGSRCTNLSGDRRSKAMSTMTYKGYAARIEYSDEDGCFLGHIAGIKDVIGFHAESVKELRLAFEEAVDDYISTCERVGRAPQKPFSGKLMLRVPPEVNARAAMMAEAHGMSINQWAADVLSKAN